jgi:hypothetical protein
MAIAPRAARRFRLGQKGSNKCAERRLNSKKVSLWEYSTECKHSCEFIAPILDTDTLEEAKQRLGFKDGERTIPFFGRITPYRAHA